MRPKASPRIAKRTAEKPDRLVAQAKAADKVGDWPSSTRLWGQCLSRFPKHRSHHSWIERRARAQANAGLFDDAVKSYTALIELRPDDPRAYEELAGLVTKQNDWSGAARLWTMCIAKFPKHAKRSEWLTASGYALLEIGKYDEAAAPFETLISEFPNDHRGHEGLARKAERQWRWREAIEHWEHCAGIVVSEARYAIIANTAHCLVQIGEIELANVLFNSISGHIEGIEGLARTALLEDGRNIAALRWEECIERFPDDVTGFLGKAGLLFDGAAYDEAEALLRQIIDRWPDAMTAELLAAQCVTAAKTWKLAGERWSNLTRNYPRHAGVQTGYVRYLAAMGDKSVVDDYLASLRSEPIAVARCLREYYLASENYGAAADQARNLVELENQNPNYRLQLAAILMRHGSPEALHAALRTLKELSYASTDSIAIKTQLAEAYIRSGFAEQAKALLESIPADEKRVDVEILRAWSSHLADDETAAKKRWNTIVSRIYVPAMHARIHSLMRIDGNDATMRMDDVLLFSIMRNEKPRLDWFLKYYRKLGVNKFIIVDNGSTDDSKKTLLENKDVILYQTPERYSAAGAGMRWINELIGRYGGKNWCLHADADEALVFPGCESLGLHGLVDYLNWKGYEAMFASMLDMYPAEVSSSERASTKDPQSSYRFFDHRFYSYGYPICPYREEFGGIRRRLFEGYQLINKVPFINGAAGIRFLLSSHRITPAKLADVTGALLHYHLVYAMESKFRPRFGDAIERREFPSNSLERLRFRDLFRGARSRETFLGDDSVEFRSSEQLLELGICEAPERFLKAVKAPIIRKDHAA